LAESRAQDEKSVLPLVVSQFEFIGP
jgi:hypothetical protein